MEFEQQLDQNVPVTVTVTVSEGAGGGEDAAVVESENSALEEEDEDLGGGDMHDENKQATLEEVSCVESLEKVHDKPILFTLTFPENQCTSTLQGNGD